MPGRAQQPITGKKLGDGDEVIARCVELEGELAELHVAWEQYFMGVERRPPTKRHDAFKKALLSLKTLTVRQVAARFRAQSLAQKALTYERLWERTLAELEAGTSRRDVRRVRARKVSVGLPQAAAEAEDLDISDFDDDVDEPAPPPVAKAVSLPPLAPMVAPVRPPAPPSHSPLPSSRAALPSVAPLVSGAGVAAPKMAPAGAPRPASMTPTDALSEQKIRAIYDAYVTAKKRCGEDTSALSLTAVADSLRKQVPTLMKQHNAKTVDFKVVIKDGKAVLRALPKE